MITVILIVASVILILWFCLPTGIKLLLNRKLGKTDGFTGRIERLRIHLITGKIVLYNTILLSTGQREPLLKLPTTIIFFSWRSLFKRIADVNIVLEAPDLFVVTKPTPDTEKQSTSSVGIPGPKAALERLMPFRLKTEVRNGNIRFITSDAKKKSELSMTEVNLTLSDLSNQKELASPCAIRCSGNLYEGSLEMNVSLSPLEPTLTLDLNLELKSINLVLLNDLLRAYGKVDVNQGILHLYTEVAVSDNAFKGYIKPILKDLDFVGTADRNDSLFQKMWESTVAVFVQLLENNRKDQIATKIPIEGRLDDPHVHVVAAIIGVLKNAFVKALTPSLEDIISVDSLWEKTKLHTRGIFKSIFKNRENGSA